MAMTNAADLTIVHLLLIGALKSVFLTAVKFQTRKGENSLCTYLSSFLSFFVFFAGYLGGHYCVGCQCTCYC